MENILPKRCITKCITKWIDCRVKIAQVVKETPQRSRNQLKKMIKLAQGVKEAPQWSRN